MEQRTSTVLHQRNLFVAVAEKTGPKMSKEKPKVMRTNSKQQEQIKLKHVEVEKVQRFTYLGRIVTSDGGADEDVKSRIGKARQVFNTLRPVWNSLSISTKTTSRTEQEWIPKEIVSRIGSATLCESQSLTQLGRP